jgi:hypothetical protein
VNSADRVIRVFDMDIMMEAGSEEDMEPLQKLQDLVNRCAWLCSHISVTPFLFTERSGGSALSLVMGSS